MVETQHLIERIAASERQDAFDWAQQVRVLRDSIDFPIHECRMSPTPREYGSDVLQQHLACICFT